jgi:opacity protein-like surface antigen
MKSRTLLSFAAAALFLMVPSSLFAQSIFVGGGATFPTGEFGDYADTGWIGVAGVLFPVGEGGLNVGVEGFYGQNNHNDVDGDKTNPYGAMAILEYDIGDDEGVGAYLFGGAGLLVHKFGTDATEGGGSETNFGYEAGAGVSFPLGGSTSLWAEGRYMGASGTNFFGILAGLGFGIG